MADEGLGRAVLELTTDSAQFFRDLDKGDSALERLKSRLKGVTQEASEFSRGVNSIANTFSTGAIPAAQQYVAAIDQIGGVTKLTNAEKARLNKTLTEAVAKYKALGTSAPADMLALHKSTLTAVSSTEKFGAGVGSAWNAIKGFAGPLGLGLGVGSLISFGKSVFDAASHTKDMADKMGVGIEAAQRFAFAAKQGGADIDQVSKSIVEMNRNLAAPDKSTVAAFKAAGLSVDDLRKKKPEEAFRAIVAAIEKIPDPALQTEVAIRLLGKTGADLLPAIREGFIKAADGATVMKDQTVRDLEAAQQAWENFFNQITIWTGEFIAGAARAWGGLADIIGSKGFFGTLKEAASAAMTAPKGVLTFGPSGLLVSMLARNEATKEAAKADAELMKFQGPLQASTKLLTDDTDKLTDAQTKAKAAAEAQAKAIENLTDKMSGAALRREVTQLNAAIAKLNAEQKKNPDVVRAMLEQIRPLVAAGGLPLLSQEAHDLYIKHAAMHDIIPKVGLDWDALLPKSKGFTLEIQKQTRSLKDELAMLDSMRQGMKSFGSIVTTNPLDILKTVTSGVKGTDLIPPSLMSTFWDSLKGQASNFGKQLGPIVMAAVTGGGDVWRSIGSLAGGLIGESLSKNFGGVIKKGLPGFLGDAVSSMLPGVGSLLAPLVSKIASSFKTLGRNVARDMQDAFATKELGFGNLAELNDELKRLGAIDLVNRGDIAQRRDDENATRKWMEDVRKFLADTKGKAEETARALEQALGGAFSRLESQMASFGGKAPAALQPLIQELLGMKGLTDDQREALEGFAGSPSWQQLQSIAEGLGIDLAALGPSFTQSKLDDTALGYARSLITLRDAGADMNGVLAGSKDELQGLVDQALKTGSSLPMAIKPFLQALADSGDLLDENGNKLENLDRFTFTGTLEDAFKDMKSILEEIRDLLAKGITDAAKTGAEETKRAWSGVRIKIPIDYEEGERPTFAAGLNVPHLATGGIVTRPMLALIGEKGAEVVRPLSQDRPSLNITIDSRGSFYPDRRSMQRHAAMITKPIIERLQDSRLAPIETVRP